MGKLVFSSRVAVLGQSQSQVAGKLQAVKAVPGKCYSYFDQLTKDRSHSFAFHLDQTRKVSIDIDNQRQPDLFGLRKSRNIQVILWSESGHNRELFSIAPGDRDRETITLKPGRYLLELKTQTHKTVDYSLKLTAMKWLMLEVFAS
jgi:hypothetical protein